MTGARIGRKAVHQGEPGQHPHQGKSAEEVAHHRHGDHAARRSAETLQHAEHPEGDDVRGEGHAEGRRHVDGRGEHQRQPPADPVAPGSHQQLPEPEADSRRREGELDDRRRYREVALQRGKRRQVEVHGERAERGQRTEDEDVHESLPGRQRVSRVDDCGHANSAAKIFSGRLSAR